jgi:hypothetical protein
LTGSAAMDPWCLFPGESWETNTSSHPFFVTSVKCTLWKSIMTASWERRKSPRGASVQIRGRGRNRIDQTMLQALGQEMPLRSPPVLFRALAGLKTPLPAQAWRGQTRGDPVSNSDSPKSYGGYKTVSPGVFVGWRIRAPLLVCDLTTLEILVKLGQ